ncbi:hypothetical protein PR048_020253 [Dryococelus australis]|uniref:Uncharacterized protein n=1 Tax=Dryococelus australis TaxID=614101 RepID=A0ABQ9H5S2_9NEOP|nr:hypothetical protein PR048_020253 [Dryococelus australis]
MLVLSQKPTSQRHRLELKTNQSTASIRWLLRLHEYTQTIWRRDSFYVVGCATLWERVLSLIGYCVQRNISYFLGSRGPGGVMVRLLASHLGELDLIPGRVAPGFSHWGIVQDDATGPRFSQGSPVSPALPFRRCSILTSHHPHRLSRPRCSEQPKSLRSTLDCRLAIKLPRTYWRMAFQHFAGQSVVPGARLRLGEERELTERRAMQAHVQCCVRTVERFRKARIPETTSSVSGVMWSGEIKVLRADEADERNRQSSGCQIDGIFHIPEVVRTLTIPRSTALRVYREDLAKAERTTLDKTVVDNR